MTVVRSLQDRRVEDALKRIFFTLNSIFTSKRTYFEKITRLFLLKTSTTIKLKVKAFKNVS